MSSIYPLVAALLANVIAQVLKPIVLYFRTKELDVHQCIACGGFPSSHSSTVTALTIAIGMNEGFDSALFAITCIQLHRYLRCSQCPLLRRQKYPADKAADQRFGNIEGFEIQRSDLSREDQKRSRP